jgi:hypothetical protein
LVKKIKESQENSVLRTFLSFQVVSLKYRQTKIKSERKKLKAERRKEGKKRGDEGGIVEGELGEPLEAAHRAGAFLVKAGDARRGAG